MDEGDFDAARLFEIGGFMWTKAILTAVAETVDTNIIGGGQVDVADGQGIYDILRLIVTILTYGLGVAATIGVVIAGVMYLTAKDSPDKVAAAKKRLIEVVIGLVAWAVMAAVLNWLIPGGVNLDTSTWGSGSSSGAGSGSGSGAAGTSGMIRMGE